jgi:hypothetical protein
MGPGETIAAIVLGLVVIAVLVVANESFNRWASYKQRMLELEALARGADRPVRHGDYVELLEERVRVLERLATDRGQDLARQIEKLRDRQQKEPS